MVEDDLGARLRRLRRQYGLTQEQLAERSGVGVRTIRRLETGVATNVHLATVNLLADALGADPDDRQQLATTALGSPAQSVAVREAKKPDGDALGGETWDVFISHASEDKAVVARPLRDALVTLRVTAWLDEAQLRIGHSLRRKIDEGIRASRYGVVVLSESFFAKGWTNHELNGLITRNVAGEQSLLPIWHNLSSDQVRRYSPSLADTIAMSTGQYSIEEIAKQIADVVGDNGHSAAQV